MLRADIAARHAALTAAMEQKASHEIFDREIKAVCSDVADVMAQADAQYAALDAALVAHVGALKADVALQADARYAAVSAALDGKASKEAFDGAVAAILEQSMKAVNAQIEGATAAVRASQQDDGVATAVAEVTVALSELRAQVDSQVLGMSDQICNIRDDVVDCRAQMQGELQSWKADLAPLWPSSLFRPASVTVED